MGPAWWHVPCTMYNAPVMAEGSLRGKDKMIHNLEPIVMLGK